MSPKGFAALAASTAICLGLAGWAVASRDVPVTATGQPQPMFAGLLDKLNDVRAMRVTGGGVEPLTLRRGDDAARWTLEQRGNYPADGQRIREVALALANLQLLEPKTAKPDMLPRLDLGDPAKPDAKAREIELLDKDGKPLASAVIGKTRFGLYGGARPGVYVRRAGDDQAWLAAGQIDLPTGATDIIPKEVMDVPTEDVGRVTLGDGGPAPLVIAKADPKAEAYVLQSPLPPEGKKVDDQKLERVASVLGSLTLQDVRPAGEVNVPADAPKARFETWDGVNVEARVLKKGEGDKAEGWVTFAVSAGQPLAPPPAPPAAAAPDAAAGTPTPAPVPAADAAKKPTAEERVADLKRKVDGWAFKLPDFAGQRLTWGINDLLAAPGDGTS